MTIMTMEEIELRAATCKWCKDGHKLESSSLHRIEKQHQTFDDYERCTYNPELLPLFQQAVAGAYAAAAKRLDASRDRIGRIMHESWTRTKRAQGFHHPYEAAHGITEAPCPKCHADLMDWDELPQEQKDINCRAFDDVLPVLIEHILALTPADARQASQQNGETSDGYHTFNELYEHRHSLFSIICRTFDGWKSKLHSDDTMFDGWFIAGVQTPQGQATYHLPLAWWERFTCKELPQAPAWDGHTPADVVTRIQTLTPSAAIASAEARAYERCAAAAKRLSQLLTFNFNAVKDEPSLETQFTEWAVAARTPDSTPKEKV